MKNKKKNIPKNGEGPQHKRQLEFRISLSSILS